VVLLLKPSSSAEKARHLWKTAEKFSTNYSTLPQLILEIPSTLMYNCTHKLIKIPDYILIVYIIQLFWFEVFFATNELMQPQLNRTKKSNSAENLSAFQIYSGFMNNFTADRSQWKEILSRSERERVSESIEWFTEGQAFLRSYNLLTTLPPSLLSLSSTGDTQENTSSKGLSHQMDWAMVDMYG
jgi:hypothetical protein